jgi:hypothetical protein
MALADATVSNNCEWNALQKLDWNLGFSHKARNPHRLTGEPQILLRERFCFFGNALHETFWNCISRQMAECMMNEPHYPVPFCQQ